MDAVEQRPCSRKSVWCVRLGDWQRGQGNWKAHASGMETCFSAQVSGKPDQEPLTRTSTWAVRGRMVRNLRCPSYQPLATATSRAAVFFSCTCAIHGGSGSEPHLTRFAFTRRTSPVRRQFAATRDALSRAGLFRPHKLLPRNGEPRGMPLAPRTSLKRVKPVPAFVVASVPGTTRKHANEATTALQLHSLSSRPLLLAGHSQTGLFNHQDDLS